MARTGYWATTLKGRGNDGLAYRQDVSLEDRLFGRIDAADALACWTWRGAKTTEGYGSIRFKGRAFYTHRVMYEIAHGFPVPSGMFTDHLCRNRLCCNPAHLEAVSPRENAIRGTGPVTGNHNGLWTHCKRGHPFDGENTEVRKEGKRGCRACRNERKRMARRRAKPND